MPRSRYAEIFQYLTLQKKKSIFSEFGEIKNTLVPWDELPGQEIIWIFITAHLKLSPRLVVPVVKASPALRVSQFLSISTLSALPPQSVRGRRSRPGAAGSAAQPRILRGETAGCCRGAGCRIPAPRPRRAGPRGGSCWTPFEPGARRRQFPKLPLGARKTGWERRAYDIYVCFSYMKPVRGNRDMELYNGTGIYFLSSAV